MLQRSNQYLCFKIDASNNKNKSTKQIPLYFFSYFWFPVEAWSKSGRCSGFPDIRVCIDVTVLLEGDAGDDGGRPDLVDGVTARFQSFDDSLESKWENKY